MSVSRILDILERRRSCKGKVRHPSRGAAEAHARAHAGTHAYACRFCLGWHVGHGQAPLGKKAP